MGRAPCCEKMGLKKGPWTPEEDQILISYIQQYGHLNWRALPKQAGLLRCGKSCRLRWTNYLRPDIKRGNFTKEEEETIIELHQMLGNRWSVIAARLPGRTDNEIKNVWHTRLKKRLEQRNFNNPRKNQPPDRSDPMISAGSQSKPIKEPISAHIAKGSPASPQQSYSDTSSSATDTSPVASSGTAEANCKHNRDEQMESSTQSLPVEVDGRLWTADHYDDVEMNSIFSGEMFDTVDWGCGSLSNDYDGMDFWYNIFIGAGGSPELPDF
ncbi:hypothetical protein Nepgr_020705 [Nepenthes gracilis]|uniref:Uncharacterized protein n=1 Tax=Nepenthes gracilis TaxID=150966 RepID=A0AAD3SXF8_NEPGR|nr:hypothetical protein Nepgr_020705 [Nepenthes gracilis]